VLKRRPLKKSKPESVTSAPLRLTMLGQPQLLEGEDPESYDELLARIRAAINPSDIFDEIHAVDVVMSEWETRRYHRLISSLLQTAVLAELEAFLQQNLPYEPCSDRFGERLMETLHDRPEDEVEDAQRLTNAYLRHESDAVERVRAILNRIGLNEYAEWQTARNEKAQELARQYSRREPAAVRLINELLASSGMKMDWLVAKANQIECIERIDRLRSHAQSRRNGSLRELGEALRQSAQQLEDAKFEVIEPASDK